MIYEYKKEIKNYKGKIAIAAAVLILLAAAAIAISIYLQVLQLNEIGGFAFVFFTNLKYKLLFGAITFVVIFLAVFTTTLFVRKNLVRYIKESNLPSRRLPLFSVSAAIALIGAFITRDFFYEKALNFIYSTPFGKTAPVIGGDIGYYIFQRPFLLSLYNFAMGLWAFIIIYTAVYYGLILLSIFENITLHTLKIKSILRHNLINIAALFIVKVFTYTFQKEQILYGNVVNVTGAGYVDVNVWLNYYRVAPFLITVIVLAALVLLMKGKLRKAAYIIAVYPAVWILVSIAALIVQNVVVKPNEVNLQNQYLKNNIDMTRSAYKLDKIKTSDFPAVQELTADILRRNPETVSNIRIVDYRPTLDNNIQLQSNTNFYTFHDGDIVNYNINGKETPVFISAREIDKNNLKDNSYINKMFKYTHGYGIVINPLNRINTQGQVEFFMSGLVMNTVDKNLKVTEPRIYYGELTNDRVIVNAANNLNEIDYDGKVETRYKGKGGIHLDFFHRLLFSALYQDPNLIISGYVSKESKILINREVIERAGKAVPFLTVDKDPYIVLAGDGKLKWVIDAYTTSSYYPYAQRYNNSNFNYIRNSVKIVVDAYDGTVNYYIVDPEDPMIATYKKIYPGLFSEEPFPADIAQHTVYPELLFKIQTEIMKRYHLDPNANPENVSNFYYNQDLWDIAQYPQNKGDGADTDKKRDIDPYYNLIKLPGISTKEELVLMRPFTPSGKDNMVSWLSVRNSYSNYGEMILYNYPKNTNIYGPYQVESNINTIDKVSKDITLWSQGGSRVFKGSLLVIPIENSVLYVEPIYIQSSGPSAIPQVKEVVIGYQRGDEFKYGIGTNLDEALSQLFQGVGQTPAPATPTPGPPSVTETQKEKLLSDIQQKYDALRKQLEELGSLINELNK